MEGRQPLKRRIEQESEEEASRLRRVGKIRHTNLYDPDRKMTRTKKTNPRKRNEIAARER